MNSEGVRVHAFFCTGSAAAAVAAAVVSAVRIALSDSATAVILADAPRQAVRSNFTLLSMARPTSLHSKLMLCEEKCLTTMLSFPNNSSGVTSWAEAFALD